MMHTRSKLAITAIAAVLLLAFLAPAYALPPQALDNRGHHHHSLTLTTGMTLRITGSGTAFQIGNKTIAKPATLALTIKVTTASFGRARLMVLNGTLTIGGQTYTVVRGHGIINLHSDKIIIKVNLKSSTNATAHLILFGKASGLVRPFNVGSSFKIDFKQPESKLASKWFVEFLDATATRVA